MVESESRISPPPASQIPFSSQVESSDWKLLSQALIPESKVPSHRTVVSRDSLPGHWADIDVEVQDGSSLDRILERPVIERTKAKKPARVSYMDMTSI